MAGKGQNVTTIAPTEVPVIVMDRVLAQTVGQVLIALVKCPQHVFMVCQIVQLVFVTAFQDIEAQLANGKRVIRRAYLPKSVTIMVNVFVIVLGLIIPVIVELHLPLVYKMVDPQIVTEVVRVQWAKQGHCANVHPAVHNV
ncbi:hypothetical protein O9G_001851 [Rozella allomycis CSF55]|uniref:Uncharacterized protein n=1 Tax=Rozella allomycis (strain CSF55) TaxID=988480 RepID=A0A075AVF0_ROZAC|nr:hypothetical protein O9G_001851 [Rozella allomycis CSF55]|eukprot:EPZ34238.1 hypothetical protein O9G_001851 [Rozella allomycis CSF55]